MPGRGMRPLPLKNRVRPEKALSEMRLRTRGKITSYTTFGTIDRTEANQRAWVECGPGGGSCSWGCSGGIGRFTDPGHSRLPEEKTGLP